MTQEQNTEGNRDNSRLEYSIDLCRRLNPDLTQSQAVVAGLAIAESVDKFVNEDDPVKRHQIIAHCLRTIDLAQNLLD